MQIMDLLISSLKNLPKLIKSFFLVLGVTEAYLFKRRLGINCTHRHTHSTYIHTMYTCTHHRVYTGCSTCDLPTEPVLHCKSHWARGLPTLHMKMWNGCTINFHLVSFLHVYMHISKPLRVCRYACVLICSYVHVYLLSFSNSFSCAVVLYATNS